MIIHSNLSKMKNEILPSCLQGNCRDNLGEFSNVLYGGFGAENLLDYRYDVISHISIGIAQKKT